MAVANLVKKIEKWSAVYDFSFQFWGEGNMNVFIAKDGIDITSFGGEDTIEAIMQRTLAWIAEKNPGGFKAPVSRHKCQGCGTAIAKGNDYCGECLCEDDSDY